ncbi:MAG: hypothetical protein AAF414_03475 [Pseudomonadota bacterium]
MNRIGLGIVGLLLASLAMTSAYACSCRPVSADEMARQGQPIADILVSGMEVIDPERGVLALSAEILQSYTGDFKADEIVISTNQSTAACGYPIEPGTMATVVLHPLDEDEVGDYSINMCTSLFVDSDEARETLAAYADQRNSGDGVWIDVVEFQRVLATFPDPETLRDAFPDVLIVLPDEIATREFRLDQSRFFAELDPAGNVTGGNFQ